MKGIAQCHGCGGTLNWNENHCVLYGELQADHAHGYQHGRVALHSSDMNEMENTRFGCKNAYC